MNQQEFEELWKVELEKARKIVEEWSAQGSEDLLIEKIIEQEEFEREQVQESVRLAVSTAVEALAKLQVLKAQIQKNAVTEEGVIFKEEPYAERLKYMEENGI